MGSLMEHDVVVLARPGHGQDFVEVYHVNRVLDEEARSKKERRREISIHDAKHLAVKYIREHRASGQGMDYRIKDMLSGTILD